MDITWLKDKWLADLDNLPNPDISALDIVENPEAGLESFRAIIASLNVKNQTKNMRYEAVAVGVVAFVSINLSFTIKQLFDTVK